MTTKFETQACVLLVEILGNYKITSKSCGLAFLTIDGEPILH